MNGIEPPSPIIAGAAAEVATARPRRSSLEPAGERRRVPARRRIVRFEHDLGAVGRICFEQRLDELAGARRHRSVGGSRSESFTDVAGRSTLPALASGGKPSSAGDR